jgi:curved DNA-binding protein CbpA
MASVKPTTDPYRILGILRGADLGQVKAAHRRLAKRYHPDGSTRDEVRFLAVQAAYQLLSDPVARRDWDRRHAPVPMPASRARTKAGPPRPRRRRSRSAATTAPTARRDGPRRAPRPYRPPGQRTATWSAEHVPWWEDFDPGGKSAPSEPQREESAGHDDETTPPAASARPRSMDFDVFDRSSGAAWSAAARQHFRRGTDDLPSRGAWRYRGTQVVTGAEARAVAAEEEEEERTRP